MNACSVIAFEVQALLSQVTTIVSNFLINRFQLIFCCSLAACDVISIPSFVSQVVYSTVSTINKNFTGIDIACYTVNRYVTSFNCAVCTVDSHSIVAFAGFHNTFCTVDINSCIAGTQCYCIL